MPKGFLWLFFGLPLLVSACGTPPEVKALSTAQIGYFNLAIEVVQKQSEALILAADTIKKQAEARIDEKEKGQLANFEDLLANKMPATQVGKRSTAKETVERITQTSQKAAAAKANLVGDLEEIKQKTEDIRAYIEQMKQVQIALDAYLQSEQAGEKVVKEILSQPSTEQFLSFVDGLLPKVSGAVNELSGLIGGLAETKG
ncbi:MAG: hypothetical protein OEU09_22310 [Rhodospirillales bacterium]|nr:hypothetical protein [Rhodospirillales bacterium]MDH3790855.1 hypothetical protein [Rhodospirillales bacterium]MDH3914022.1 hypothetical protein [Rhodospirillales bacterium]MDH3919377.1 hypothetical protein [Rhodospirillales bacterium]MDH3968694.1 hypothetical protein [Rhodospirillales bacterium]